MVLEMPGPASSMPRPGVALQGIHGGLVRAAVSLCSCAELELARRCFTPLFYSLPPPPSHLCLHYLRHFLSPPPWQLCCTGAALELQLASCLLLLQVLTPQLTDCCMALPPSMLGSSAAPLHFICSLPLHTLTCRASLQATWRRWALHAKHAMQWARHARSEALERGWLQPGEGLDADKAKAGSGSGSVGGWGWELQ
jgi:hypothetical protein